MIVSVRKRDGREMPFNIEKIVDAIVKAFRASGELDEQIKAADSNPRARMFLKSKKSRTLSKRL